MAVTISSSVALSLGSNMAVIMDTYSESTAAKTTHVFHSDLAPVSYTHLDVYKRQCFVLPLLMAADDGFASLLSGFVGRLAAWFSGWRDSWTEFVVKVFFALPTALYLYGLVYGAVRGRRACVYDKKEVCAVQRGLRFAPRSTVLTALFVLCAVYLLFISMQAKYLLSCLLYTSRCV